MALLGFSWPGRREAEADLRAGRSAGEFPLAGSPSVRCVAGETGFLISSSPIISSVEAVLTCKGQALRECVAQSRQAPGHRRDRGIDATKASEARALVIQARTASAFL